MPRVMTSSTSTQHRAAVTAAIEAFRRGQVVLIRDEAAVDNWRKLLNLDLMYHRALADMQQAMALARTVRERGIRHLHAHFGTIATTVSRLAAAMAGITYSFTAHAKDIFHEDVQGERIVLARGRAGTGRKRSRHEAIDNDHDN